MSRSRVLVVTVVAVFVAAAVVFGLSGQRQATVEEHAQALPGNAAPGDSSDLSGPTDDDDAATAHKDLDEAMPAPTPAPAVWDAAVAESATQTAKAALEAFARPSGPEIDAEAWWTRLEPTLSVAAAKIYERVDPRLVPYTRVLQVDAAQRAGSDLVATVSADTDAGFYDVLLARADGVSPWFVEQLRPQEPR